MTDVTTVKELHDLIEAGRSPTIIDVRTDERHGQGHLPGVLHIPYAQLKARLSEVPRDKPVVTY